MYVMITSKCNMKCAHCIYSCTEKGIDMSIPTFKQTLTFMLKPDQLLPDGQFVLGGGEPTLHPLFATLLTTMIDIYPSLQPLMVTNGSVPHNLNKYLDLVVMNAANVELSIDKFHEPVDNDATRRLLQLTTGASTRDTSNHLFYLGRAAKNDLGNRNRDYCKCCDTLIDPAGGIYLCGCPSSPKIGTVWVDTKLTVPPEWHRYECWSLYKRGLNDNKVDRLKFKSWARAMNFNCLDTLDENLNSFRTIK